MQVHDAEKKQYFSKAEKELKFININAESAKYLRSINDLAKVSIALNDQIRKSNNHFFHTELSKCLGVRIIVFLSIVSNGNVQDMNWFINFTLEEKKKSVQYLKDFISKDQNWNFTE